MSFPIKKNTKKDKDKMNVELEECNKIDKKYSLISVCAAFFFFFFLFEIINDTVHYLF